VIAPLSRLDTPRLVLRASDPALAGAVAAYLQRNRSAHARWNPPMAEQMFTAEGQAERLAGAALAESEGTQVGWWLSRREDTTTVIGHARLSQLSRGPFQSAMLGYAIDHAYEGRGLMHEALQAVLADAFGLRVALHRVQANARVENRRSLALLERLGFVREGVAREYLFIDGAWRDHVLSARLNPHWPAEQGP
jgi:ribosomal-protein-alanine N-acetyltransferase